LLILTWGVTDLLTSFFTALLKIKVTHKNINICIEKEINFHEQKQEIGTRQRQQDGDCPVLHHA
jgi:hypothetical protein